MRTVTLRAYAKLNLTLDILGRRPDGYHDLETVMQTVSLHDDVKVTTDAGGGIVCRCGADLPGDERNLACRAAQLFCETYGVPAHVEIDVRKRIPMGAGMGGGSADAAAVLRALRDLLLPELAWEELETLGARIGSDVPFCVRGGTALAEGRGERLTPLPPAPRLCAVVCKPTFSISTAALYRRADEVAITEHPDTPGALAAIRSGDVSALLERVYNVFEQVLPEEYEEILALHELFYEQGADAAAMTGSGSAVYGLYRDERAAREVAAILGKSYYEQTFLTTFV